MRKSHIFIRLFVMLGFFVIVSCGRSGNVTETSYQFNLSPDEVIEFKSGLRDYASQNGHNFVDGSRQTSQDRESLNREIENSSNEATEFVNQSIIDVTVEPEDSNLNFLIFSKTSAYDSEIVSLTVIYDNNSALETSMADDFFQSQFLRTWVSDSISR